MPSLLDFVVGRTSRSARVLLDPLLVLQRSDKLWPGGILLADSEGPPHYGPEADFLT